MNWFKKKNNEDLELIDQSAEYPEFKEESLLMTYEDCDGLLLQEIYDNRDKHNFFDAVRWFEVLLTKKDELVSDGHLIWKEELVISLCGEFFQIKSNRNELKGFDGLTFKCEEYYVHIFKRADQIC